MSWERYRLGDLYEVHNGLSKGSKFFGSGYGFLSFSTVFNNYFIPDELPDLVQSTEKEQESYSIKRGDIFLTRTSETADELGMSCVALKDYPHATYNGFTKRLRPITDKVVPEYIGYYMRMPSFRNEFMAFSTMTTRASLRNEDLLGLKVNLPNLDKQSSIANILREYDYLIENNQKQIKLLEEAAQRLYKEWFIDHHFPGYENVKIVDSIPEGWNIRKLADVADIIMGQSPTSDTFNLNRNGLPFHQGVGSYGNRYVKNKVYTTSYTRIANADSILFSVRAPVGRLNVTKNKIVIGRGLAAFNQKQGYQNYLFYMLKEHYFKDDLIGNGSIFSSITKNELMNQKFIIPDTKTMLAYDNIAKIIDKKIDNLDCQIDLISEARNRLLPKLMSGEIEI
ncbi:restriction endonuclease subunit S [Mitsuokella jalaludinii]|jgi:type I restriction enzyme S subunit|uniref:restriction endonuclease subunit S n=1 Tax=Mitsuokella jalaludinii TaxID=187979 RepID=UPI003079C314